MATITEYLFWDFNGLNSPALDTTTDETPPTHRGVIRTLFTEVDGAPATTVASAVQFYFDQGITAQDLLKMVGEDVAARVPIATIRARTTAPAGSARGTVVAWSRPQTQYTTDYIPVEII